MAQSSGRPIGERLQIAVFALGSSDRREEVRNGGFSDLLRSEFDLEYFR